MIAKMQCVTIVILSCLWILVNAFDNNFTFTYNMAMQCKEHLCRHGYSYETFYELESKELSHVTRDKTVMDLEMHIAILAANNGHILLSSVPHPDRSDPVYEIVVGGGTNKFTELRRNLRHNAKASAKTMGVLSPVEFRGFFIRISEDGVIEFGREGDKLPLLSYTDVNPIPINYFSFAAWTGIEAKFLYDCPPPGDNTISPDSKEVEEKLSSAQLTKRTLLMGRQPKLSPRETMNVKVGFQITSVRYDAFTTKLTTGMAVVVSWTDDSMAWNPSKFNGTTSLTFRQGQIWTPSFYVLNSDGISVMRSKNPELITMENSGEATFHFHTKLQSWCWKSNKSFSHIDFGSMGTWPHDEYSCALYVEAAEVFEKIVLEQLSIHDKKMKVFADVDDVVKNEFETSFKWMVFPVQFWNSISRFRENTTYMSDKVMLVINLKRVDTTYNIVFYTPLLVLVLFVLMSFWSEPLQMSRISFYAGATNVICSGLCYIEYLIPCHTVPFILKLYMTVLVGILLALLIHVLMMTSATERLCKTVMMQSLLTAKWFRTVFCLPAMKTCRNYDTINEAYATQDEDDESGVVIAPRNGNIEEMETDNNKYGEREELAEAVDKILFFTYSVVFAAMLACRQ